jgi:soluble lytic murein transglycosylase
VTAAKQRAVRHGVALAVTAACSCLAAAATHASASAALTPYFGTSAFQAPARDYRAGNFAAAVSGFRRELAAARTDTEERLRARLLLGLALGRLARFDACAAEFVGLSRKDPLLSSYYAYNAARCYLLSGDSAQGLAWADRVPRDSVPAAEAELVALDALRRSERWAEALARADRFVADFPQGPRLHEALAAAALALERLGRRDQAAIRWRAVWSRSTSESWVERADRKLAELETGLADHQRPAAIRTAGDYVARGMVLFERNDNEMAEAAFARALRAPGLDPTLECRARYHLGQSVWKLRDRLRAVPLFAQAESACRAAKDADLTVKAIYQKARCLPFARDRPGAMAHYARIEADHPDHSYADDARLRAAEEATVEGLPAQAERLLATLPDLYPAGDMVGEALWRRAFGRLQSGDLDGARVILEDNLRRVPRESVWYAEGRAEYWLGRIEQQRGRTEQAGSRYEQAIRRYPLSVYAWQSFLRLDTMAPARKRRLLAELRVRLPRPPPAGTPAIGALMRDPGVARALALARTGLVPEAHREFARSLRLLAPSASSAGRAVDLAWVAALVLHRGGLWNPSHALVAEQIADFRLRYPRSEGPGYWQVAYPRAFAEQIEKATGEQRLPSALQFALMREESAFDPRAVSTAGCLGLTMIKPATAESYLPGPVSRSQLFSPVTNVDIGAKELARHLARYDGAVWLAIAAYNSGRGRVDSWTRRFGVVPMDEFLERIPLDETRGYTKRVLASYFAYSWLYDEARPIPEVKVAAHQGRSVHR